MEEALTPDPGLGALVTEFVADRDALIRRYPLSKSSKGIQRSISLHQDWLDRIERIPFDKLSFDGQIDWILFRNHLQWGIQTLDRTNGDAAKLSELLPFSQIIVDLESDRMAMISPEPEATAAKLDQLADEIPHAVGKMNDASVVAWIFELKEAVGRWRAFYSGYDPVLDWWIKEPLVRVMSAFEELKDTTTEGNTIPGHPFGREALEKDLAFEMLPYSPEELIEIGEREYAWCLEEMKKASGELGYGDDWKAAMESVKRTCVPPGGQPAMVRDLALEAIAFVDELVTVPELAKETWRMEMMTPAQQKVNPFFLGGESIIVSYPTDSMTHQEKLMSMRGNNPNFSRATVQHELIPGHHLQMYMTARHRPYRQLFSTPFWIEGWTLYWELLLWELGFPRTPAERIGMLFWRMHRCVRVSFSLRFHLGELSTAECVEILVDRVGHERANAEGEVRRSFNGLYPPLYQAAYLIGGLQFRSISRELRAKGWSYRAVHDEMLKQNEMPPAMMRAALLGEPIAPQPPVWRFE